MFKTKLIPFLMFLGLPKIISAQDGFAAGVRFNHNKYDQLLTCPTMSRNGGELSLPKSASLKRFAPKAGNQGTASTSLAWAIAYALTIQEARQTNKTLPADIQKIFYSPAFIYYQIKNSGDINCMGGADLTTAMPALQQSGLLLDADLKTDCLSTVSDDLKSKVIKGKVPNLLRLINYKNFREGELKMALSDKNPVILVLADKRNPNGLGQALCVVGYDDNKNGGSFEVLNSVGTAWGINGYKWITYNDLKEQVVYAVEVPTVDWRCAQPFKSTFKLLDGKNEIQLKPVANQIGLFTAVNPVTADTELQMEVNHSKEAYVYILNFDASKTVSVMFESQTKQINQLTLPSRNAAFGFDEKKGREFYCILLSHKALDMQQLVTKMNAAKKETWGQSIEIALGEALANGMVGEANINYTTKVGLKVDMATKQNVAAIIIEFDHR